jgi:hypothetical protein
MNISPDWYPVFTMIRRFKWRVLKVKVYLRFVFEWEVRDSAQGTDGTS